MEKSIILGILLAVSEVMALVKKLNSNGIIDLVVNTYKKIRDLFKK